MKAYICSCILTKPKSDGFSNIEGRHGVVLCESFTPEELIKREFMQSPNVFSLILEGFALKAFRADLLDPEIAPMNREKA